MAAYHTQQINVGSVQAPEVGSIFTDLADRLSKNYQQGLQNTKTGAELARQQVLNQRADVEWDKQQAVQQASKDIARELTNTPYAQKFGGAENTALIDAEILKETERRDKLGLAPFNAEEAAGIQKTYEANRPFKEDARGKIAAMLMSRGASAAQANQEAEGLTAGMISRADQQTIANQTRDDQQKYYDKVADTRLEVYKALQSNDLERAKMLMGTMGGVGGASAKGGGIGLGTSWDDVMSKDHNLSPWGTGWMGDNARVRDLAVAARKDGVSPWAFEKALDNSITRSSSGDNIDEEALKTNLAMYGAVEKKLRAGQSGDSAAAAGIDVSSLLNRQYAPQQVAGYNPDRMEALLKQNAPFLYKGQGSTGPSGVSEKVIQSNPDAAKTGKGNTLADINFNPGNLKNSPNNDWEGGHEGEGGFVKFDTPELGARALAKTINRNVGMTVNGFINKYAPSSENDTGSYINQVSKSLGKKPDETITKEDIPALMKVIAKREGGSFTDDQLNGGYKLFLNETTKGDTSKLPEITAVDRAYDRLADVIEPNLPKDTELTQEKKQELINKYGNTSAAIKAQIDALNASGGSMEDTNRLSKLQALNQQYKDAVAAETMRPMPTDVGKRNLLELLGINMSRPKTTPMTDERKAQENPDASKQESGLEDMSLDMIPMGSGIERAGKAGYTAVRSGAAKDAIVNAGTALKNKLASTIAPRGIEPMTIAPEITKSTATVSKGLKDLTPGKQDIVRRVEEGTKRYENANDLNNYMGTKNAAQAKYNYALDAYEKGQISKADLQGVMQEVNGIIPTKELMLQAESVINKMRTNVPKELPQLPYYEGMPSNWVNPYAGRVATNKIEGVGVDSVVAQGNNATKINELLKAQREADQAKQELLNVSKGRGTTLSKPGYWDEVSSRVQVTQAKDAMMDAGNKLREFIQEKGGDLRTTEGRQLKKAADEATLYYNKLAGYYTGR